METKIVGVKEIDMNNMCKTSFRKLISSYWFPDIV